MSLLLEPVINFCKNCLNNVLCPSGGACIPARMCYCATGQLDGVDSRANELDITFCPRLSDSDMINYLFDIHALCHPARLIFMS